MKMMRNFITVSGVQTDRASNEKYKETFADVTNI